jgi:hypothetical protein
MADLKDIIAKREELMKAGNTNYTDAMAEARRQVTASQAPTAPTQQTDWIGDFSKIKKREPVAPTQQTDWIGDFSKIKKREPVAPTQQTDG